MMRLKPHEDGPNVNIVTRSGITTREDKGKQPEVDVWVHKAADKKTGFDVKKVKEKFMEEKSSFMDGGASTPWTQNMGKSEDTNTAQEAYPSLLASFFKTSMKLLRDKKAVEGLEELIDNCIGLPILSQVCFGRTFASDPKSRITWSISYSPICAVNLIS